MGGGGGGGGPSLSESMDPLLNRFVEIHRFIQKHYEWVTELLSQYIYSETLIHSGRAILSWHGARCELGSGAPLVHSRSCSFPLGLLERGWSFFLLRGPLEAQGLHSGTKQVPVLEWVTESFTQPICPNTLIQ